jgi:hypothetical protein
MPDAPVAQGSFVTPVVPSVSFHIVGRQSGEAKESAAGGIHSFRCHLFPQFRFQDFPRCIARQRGQQFKPATF